MTIGDTRPNFQCKVKIWLANFLRPGVITAIEMLNVRGMSNACQTHQSLRVLRNSPAAMMMFKHELHIYLHESRRDYMLRECFDGLGS